ncbi:MAG: hypothetical protein LIP77_02440, partial [Planctomycetes bacterium]|nr:hypothetical protein [Planctomycetota bacterium]
MGATSSVRQALPGIVSLTTAARRPTVFRPYTGNALSFGPSGGVRAAVVCRPPPTAAGGVFLVTRI